MKMSYNKWTKYTLSQIKDELRARGLPVSGHKLELVKRLEDMDEGMATMDTDNTSLYSEDEEVTSLPDLDGSDFGDFDGDPLPYDEEADSSEIESVVSSLDDICFYNDIEDNAHCDASIINPNIKKLVETGENAHLSDSDLEELIFDNSKGQTHLNEKRQQSVKKRTSLTCSSKDNIDRRFEERSHPVVEKHNSLHESDIQDFYEDNEDDFYDIFNVDNTNTGSCGKNDYSKFNTEVLGSIMSSVDMDTDKNTYNPGNPYNHNIGMSLPLTVKQEDFSSEENGHRYLDENNINTAKVNRNSENSSCIKIKTENKGRSISRQWVLGGICTDTGDMFLQPVMKRNKETLIPSILKYAAPGSTIITDEWKAYKSLSQHGYIHKTVNHSKNFVDPVTGAHTQKIENQW